MSSMMAATRRFEQLVQYVSLCAEAVCWRVQSEPRLRVEMHAARALTERIQDAGTEVVKAKVLLLSSCSMHRWGAHT